MNPDMAEKIAHTRTLVCALPPDGVEGTEGEEHLRLAMSLGRTILVWRPPGSENAPFPKVLKGYADYQVVGGDPIAFTKVLISFLNLKPGKIPKVLNAPYYPDRSGEDGHPADDVVCEVCGKETAYVHIQAKTHSMTYCKECWNVEVDRVKQAREG